MYILSVCHSLFQTVSLVAVQFPRSGINWTSILQLGQRVYFLEAGRSRSLDKQIIWSPFDETENHLILYAQYSKYAVNWNSAFVFGYGALLWVYLPKSFSPPLAGATATNSITRSDGMAFIVRFFKCVARTLYSAINWDFYTVPTNKSQTFVRLARGHEPIQHRCTLHPVVFARSNNSWRFHCKRFRLYFWTWLQKFAIIQ